MFELSQRSLDRLEGVHEDLVGVVHEAIKITAIDFSVLEGVRTLETQREYVRRGVSRTLNSRHLTGHAVDLGAYVAGGIRWEMPLYHEIARAMYVAAGGELTERGELIDGSLDIAIQWGFDLWGWDSPHFQLSWKEYPTGS